MDREQRGEQRKRLNEIVEVLRRNEIVRGMTPDKLCAVMEELGPTFIKLGQILSMRSDFLPQEYCDALTRLRTQVEPMPFGAGGNHPGGRLRASSFGCVFIL